MPVVLSDSASAPLDSATSCSSGLAMMMAGACRSTAGKEQIVRYYRQPTVQKRTLFMAYKLGRWFSCFSLGFGFDISAA